MKLTRFNILAILTLAVIGIAGCSNWERTTFQALSASKATIDQAQADYEGGTVLPHTASVYNAINAAKAAQTAAVNQMIAYETLKATTPNSPQLAVIQSQVATALSGLPQLISAIKALYTPAGSSMLNNNTVLTSSGGI